VVGVAEGRRGSPGRVGGGLLPSVGDSGTADAAVVAVVVAGTGSGMSPLGGADGAPASGSGETGRVPGVRVGVWPAASGGVARDGVPAVLVAEAERTISGEPATCDSSPTSNSGGASSTGVDGPASIPKKSSTRAATPGRGEAEAAGLGADCSKIAGSAVGVSVGSIQTRLPSGVIVRVVPRASDQPTAPLTVRHTAMRMICRRCCGPT
jgi:hypothetical protein